MRGIKLVLLLVGAICVLLYLALRHPRFDRFHGQDLVTNTKELSSEISVLPKNHASASILDRWFSRTSTDLLAGGRSIPIAFANGVSKELKKVISSELNLIYGHLKQSEFYEGRLPTPVFNGVPVKVDKLILFRGKGRFFPYEHDGAIGFILDEQIIVPDNLVLAYEEAISRMFDNQEAYASLLETLSQLNNVDALGQADLLTWFYLTDDAKDAGIKIPLMTLKNFQNAYGRYEYLKPSILNINYEEIDELRLMAKVYVKMENGDRSSGSPPMLYQDNKWKFVISKPPA